MSANDVVARAREAMEGITPGPWVVNTEGWAVISSGGDSVIHGYYEADCLDCGNANAGDGEVAMSFEDRAFIAAAPSLVADLLAEVERLRRRIGGVNLLAHTWNNATEATTGSPSIVAKAFAAEVWKAMEGSDD